MNQRYKLVLIIVICQSAYFLYKKHLTIEIVNIGLGHENIEILAL
jgi:hypothetical protein